jgi:hypothetical protein
MIYKKHKKIAKDQRKTTISYLNIQLIKNNIS